MTTSVNPSSVAPAGLLVCAEESPAFRIGTSGRPLHLDDVGDLIAAIPALVGFPPERSLVVVVLGTAPAHPGCARIDSVIRLDLEDIDGRRIAAASLAACVAEICARESIGEVLAVIVDDRAREPAPTAEHRGAGPGRWGALIGAFARRLAEHGIQLDAAWAVRAIAVDQRWWSVPEANEYGRVPDPASSMVTLSRVLDGRQLCGSRAELAAILAADPGLGTAVAAQLDRALGAAHDRYVHAVRRGDPNSYSRWELERMLFQIACTASGAVLEAPELAELAAALRDRAVRDTMFALALGDHAAAAERLLVLLVRSLSGTDRAEAAALLGYSAYVRGDGPFAGVALEAALTADPAHALAMLLETALRTGLRPDRLRRLARSGYEHATDLGIDIGPPIR